MAGEGTSMVKKGVLDWLLESDPSIRYQVYRDLLDEPEKKLERLRGMIINEGWGSAYMMHMNPDCSWGDGYYRPKWTCTHKHFLS